MGETLEQPDEKRFLPVDRRERVVLIDVLRGVALLGILLVNMPLYNAPLALSMTNVEWWTSPVDRAVELTIRFLAQGKFISIFSFLFGLGFAIQLERAEERGRSPGRFFARRMAWLSVFGLIHAFLIWYGDVLVLYSLLGLVLIAFRKRREKTLRIWTVVLLAVPALLAACFVGIVELGSLFPEARAEIESSFAEAEAEYESNVDRARAAYAEGTLGAVLAQRARDTLQIWTASVFFGPYVLALFLIGVQVGRRRLLHHAAFHAPTFRRALPWLAAVGLVGNALMLAAAEAAPHPALPSPLGLLSQLGFVIGVPTLAAAYVAGLALAWQDEGWRSRLAPFRDIGRMALTNYLAQSVICTALFNSHGLALYGRVPPWVGLLLTLAIFGAQVVASRWWLARFRFGPMEWLWRTLTYARRQPMRRAT